MKYFIYDDIASKIFIPALIRLEGKKNWEDKINFV